MGMKYTILVIEDDKEMIENIAGILQLADYHVLTALNGRDGIAQAQRHKPDLILCDIMMPELDGFGVLKILSNNPQTAGIPFIFLTAKADRSDLRMGMDLGADDYITKPFDGSELLKVVDVRLRKHEHIVSSAESKIEDLDQFYSHARQLKEFQNLSQNRVIRKIRKKDFIYMEGLEPNDLFVIRKGIIKTYKTTQDGKELVTGLHKEGEFIGFLPLIENTPYNESAVVLEDAEVYLIPKDDFLSLIYTNHEIARNFIRILSSNLHETEQRLMEMAYQSVRQRVASALIKICEQVYPNERGKLINLARKDISGLVGTATESLNRTLADFRDEHILELTESGIRILDKKKLEHIAQ
jgi:CRP-like cAMP-binding protein